MTFSGYTHSRLAVKPMGMLLLEVQPDYIASLHCHMGRYAGCDVARCRRYHHERIRASGLNQHHLTSPKRVSTKLNMFGSQPQLHITHHWAHHWLAAVLYTK